MSLLLLLLLYRYRFVQRTTKKREMVFRSRRKVRLERRRRRFDWWNAPRLEEEARCKELELSELELELTSLNRLLESFESLLSFLFSFLFSFFSTSLL